MVSQFISPHNVQLLSDLTFNFPENTHAVGRLDNNSEGLLILTTDKSITRLLFQTSIPHEREYLVHVKNIVSQTAVEHLRAGVSIRIKGGENYITAPCKVLLVEDPGLFYMHQNKLDYTNQKPGSWLLITLMEGKYHQVRKMMAAIRHRCSRLIRVRIEGILLGDLSPGEVREVEKKEFFNLLKLG